ncbi:MAG: AtzE family amidohydrolase [Alphaproteobacteria bacterium]
MSVETLLDGDGVALARAVKRGEVKALEVTEAALARIAVRNPVLNAYTDVTAERAQKSAKAIDAAIAAGKPVGPLAGVPIAVKNLFDVAGLPTRAGSKINRELPPASADAPLIQRLEAQGAILMGALNMGEYAYDFTGENVHDGPSRNPHDTTRMSGGSSGGSGSAVAGGLAHVALGSDTNGSIRVPSSFCGLFGLKPTYGRLTRAGTFPFVAAFDHLGPMARSTRDLVAAYDAMVGPDPADPACVTRKAEPVGAKLGRGIGDLKIGRLTGWFAKNGLDEAFAAVDQVAHALKVTASVDLTGAERARGAAFLITMAEAGQFHLERLKARADDFDPDTRDRLIAGALLPAAWILNAQRIRRAFMAEVASAFESFDVFIAPATPMVAPAIGQKMMELGGQTMPVRANIGLFTQPLSCVGLPVVAVPVRVKGQALPIGVQVVAKPFREDLALRVARHLEREGVSISGVAPFKT